MNSLKDIDMDKKIGLRKGLDLTYFGNRIYIELRDRLNAYFDELDTKIIELSDGTKSIAEVINILLRKGDSFADFNNREIYSRIERLIKDGYIISRSKLKYRSVDIAGEKGKYYPKDISIELTNKCNFYCSFCYKNASNEGNYISDKLITYIDALIKEKVRTVLLTGGEPTLHPNLSKYIDMFSRYAKVDLVSNGSVFYKLDKDVVKKLNNVQFSLYGINEKEYKHNTGVADGLDRLKKSIELLRDCGRNITLAATVHKGNIDSIEEYICTAIKLGASQIKMDEAYLFGRQLYNYQDDYEYKDKTLRLYDDLQKLKMKYSNQIKVALNTMNLSMFSEKDIDFCKMTKAACLNCGAGFNRFVISQDGNLRGCECLPEEYFNMGTVDLLEDIIDGKMLSNLWKEKVRDFYEDNNLDEKLEISCLALEDYYHRVIC